MFDHATQADYAEPSVFWSVNTPGGSMLLAQCMHPESNGEHPDVPLGFQCQAHYRSVYYCDDRAELWCDGGPPDYEWHSLDAVAREA